MQLVFSILILMGCLIFIEELSRKCKYFALTLFFIFPLLLLPLWIHLHAFPLFYYFKTYSVAFAATFILAIQAGYIKENKWSSFVLYAFLVINILEAVLEDIFGYSMAHYLNAGAGVMLILALPGIQKIRFSKLRPERDLLWDLSYAWIIGYTLWNWTFVYLNFPAACARNLAVLGAALLISLIQRERWIQARAFTLGAYLIADLSSFGVMPAFIATPEWYHPNIGMGLAVLSVGFMGVVFIHPLYQTFKKIR